MGLRRPLSGSITSKFLNEHLVVTYGKPEMENRVTAVLCLLAWVKVRFPFEGPLLFLDRPKVWQATSLVMLEAGGGISWSEGQDGT